MKKIIIFEQEEKSAGVLANYIRKNFTCRILISTTGIETLDLIEKECPDIIILEIGEQVQDGLKVLENIRYGLYKNIVVILITNDCDIIECVFELGVAHTTTKPVRFNLMFNILEEYLPIRKNFNEHKKVS